MNCQFVTTAFLFLFGFRHTTILELMHSRGTTGVHAQRGSKIQFHAAASVFTGGVSAADQEEIKRILGSKLEKSAGKIKTVRNLWWLPHRDKHNLSEFITPGDINRGGEMGSFVLEMAHSERLKFGTMQGYVWCAQIMHIHEFGAAGDPLDGVADWSRFMSALEVQAFVDSTVEPRLMIPFMLLVRTLRALDPSNRTDSALGCLMCMMYYTMSRSESPLPKSATSFSQTKHVRRCDVRLLFDQYVEWGLGSIKQDQRSKRTRKDPDHRDWKPCGECTGVLSMNYWFNAYVNLSSWKKDTDPFFYGNNGNALTYPFMLNYMRVCMTRVEGVTWAMAVLYGFHGLRVLGYNCWRAAEGEDIAILQGGWGSLAHRVYGRQDLAKILGMAQKGAYYAASNALAPMPLDGALPPNVIAPSPAALSPVPPVQTLVTPSPVVPAPAVSSSAPAGADSSFWPADAVEVLRTATARDYKVFRWNSKTYTSRRSLSKAYKSSAFVQRLLSLGYGLRSQ